MLYIQHVSALRTEYRVLLRVRHTCTDDLMMSLKFFSAPTQCPRCPDTNGVTGEHSGAFAD